MSTASPTSITTSSTATDVDVSGVSFASRASALGRARQLGGTFSWADGRYAVYGEVSYSASVDDSCRQQQLQGHGRLPRPVVTALLSFLRMILSENRFTLFGIMR